MGRRCLYTSELAVEICERLAAGESLRAICCDLHIPAEATVRGWVVDDVQGFAAHYTRARDKGLDALADAALEEASATREAVIVTDKDWGENPGTETKHVDAVDRSRLKVDTIKWYLSKLAPKRYGERLAVEHSGTVSVEQRLMEGRKRVSAT